MPVHQKASSPETRQLILQAAGEVFAEAGFRNATVRAICQRAGANIAAVNYHFGDKEQLYLEVLRFAQTYAHQKYPSNMGINADASGEDKLRAFIRAFLFRLFDEGPIAWHAKLMAREMVEPTAALDMLVKEKIRPQAVLLRGIVTELIGANASAETTRLCASSVVSQCLFYLHCRAVIERLFPEQKYDEKELEGLADHITRFSLAALKEMAKKSRKGR
jgi:AcrR family transcriptional regulator